MTPEEQAQVNAMFRFYETQVANLTSSGAQAAGMAERLALKVKELEARIAEGDKAKEENPKAE